MKALVCLAAVYLIAWCAVDIAIKLEQEQAIARIAHSVCSLAIASDYRDYGGRSACGAQLTVAQALRLTR